MNPQQPYNQGSPQPPQYPQQQAPVQYGQAQVPYGGQPPIAPSVQANFVRAEEPKTWKIIGIIAIITTLIAVGFLVWALVNYIDQRDNVNAKVSNAVSVAVKEQADKDAAAYQEKEKEPNRQFSGPEDYGSLAFNYPKTWSVYVAKDAVTGGDFEAYLHPGVISPVQQSQVYALRVTISSTDYNKAVDGYKSLVTKGDLTSSAVKINGDNTGTRLDGSFTKDIRGSAVVFKIRDKTVTIRSDAQTFRSDFDKIISTINFNE